MIHQSPLTIVPDLIRGASSILWLSPQDYKNLYEELTWNYVDVQFYVLVFVTMTKFCLLMDCNL